MNSDNIVSADMYQLFLWAKADFLRILFGKAANFAVNVYLDAKSDEYKSLLQVHPRKFKQIISTLIPPNSALIG